MWDSRMCLYYFDVVLAQAFRQKRLELGIEGARGAVHFDKARFSHLYGVPSTHPLKCFSVGNAIECSQFALGVFAPQWRTWGK